MLFIISELNIQALKNNLISLDIEYEIIKSVSITDTYTDEYDQIYLIYESEKEYEIEVELNNEYENVELYVNGDPIAYIETILENEPYCFSFSFKEEPTNVVITAFGQKKKVDEWEKRRTVRNRSRRKEEWLKRPEKIKRRTEREKHCEDCNARA